MSRRKTSWMQRKTRCDAWWAPLGDAERWNLYLRSRDLSWTEAAALVAKEYPDLKRIRNAESWYGFCSQMRHEDANHRTQEAIRASQEAAVLADTVGASAEAAKAFLALGLDIAMRTGSAEASEVWVRQAAMLFRQAQRETELKIRQEEQDLSREKFESAERRLAAATETISDQTITPEEREARLKQIFGITGATPLPQGAAATPEPRPCPEP